MTLRNAGLLAIAATTLVGCVGVDDDDEGGLETETVTSALYDCLGSRSDPVDFAISDQCTDQGGNRGFLYTYRNNACAYDGFIPHTLEYLRTNGSVYQTITFGSATTSAHSPATVPVSPINGTDSRTGLARPVKIRVYLNPTRAGNETRFKDNMVEMWCS